MQAVTTSAGARSRPSHVPRRSLASLYIEAPQEEVTLDEFELLSLDRLQLLRSIEVLKTRGFEDRELATKIAQQERKIASTRKDLSSRLTEQKRDQISHFIMRLAYCRTEDLRRWFLQQESVLFKYRLDEMSDAERETFMRENGLHFDIVPNDEKNRRMDKLMGLSGVNNEVGFHNTNYYKIPFTEALSLIHTRAVYLEAGFAYVPLNKLVSIITTRFRTHLSRALSEAASKFEIASSDVRIAPLLKNMNKQFIGNDFSQKSSNVDKLTPDQVETASELHMPLCMKNLHNNLKREHKLKHWGRLQYGLFLKGAGLDMEGTLQFMEMHFSKLMSHDQFVKNYSYTFRHMHGKEGARKNYTPYSCMKIIMGNPPEPGAHHGCPYKHMSDNQLINTLNSLKIGANDTREIVTLAKNTHYQLACQKHFDVTHPGHDNMNIKGSEGVANHPNQWFITSVAYHKAKSGSTSSTTSGNTGVPASATSAPASSVSANLSV